jgi:uncharacterized OsmC-like protein
MTNTVNLGFDRDALDDLIDGIKDDPEQARTVWRARTHWDEGFRSEAVIERQDRRFTIPMDEPAGIGGSDTAPNMVEVVLGAYGSCLTTGLVANAALEGIELTRVEVELEGDLDLRGFFGLADPEQVWPGYSDVRATVRLEAPNATPAQLEELYARVVRTSPVGSTIARPVPITTELVIGAGGGDGA